MSGNKGEAKIIQTSFPAYASEIVEYSQKVDGKTLYFNGRIRPNAGDKERSWQDIFQKVD
jgi:hypothetical protein